VRILFLGDFEDTEIVPAPIKVGKELFRSFKSSGHHIYYLPYFQDGNIYSRIQKLFGFEKITDKVYRTGIIPLLVFVMKFRPKLIHIFTPGLYYMVLFPLRIIFRYRIISTLHSINRYVLPHLSHLKGYQKFRFLLIDYLLVKYSDYLFVYSKRDKRYISMYYKVKTHKIIVVDNGFNEINIRKEDFSCNFPLKVAFVGQINRMEKDFDLLINALYLLNLPVKLSVYSHNKQLERESNKSKNVDLQIHDPLPENELRKELIKSDLFILPSIYESFSISLLEAMSTGILFLTSSRVGLSERFKGDLTGLIFRKNDAENLLERINYLLNLTDDQKTQLSTNIIKFTKSFYWAKISREYLKTYDGIIKN